MSELKEETKECPYKNFHYSKHGNDCNISDVICSNEVFNYKLCYTYSEFIKLKREWKVNNHEFT